MTVLILQMVITRANKHGGTIVIYSNSYETGVATAGGERGIKVFVAASWEACRRS